MSPSSINYPGVSPGCTLAVTNTTGLFPFKHLGVFVGNSPEITSSRYEEKFSMDDIVRSSTSLWSSEYVRTSL